MVAKSNIGQLGHLKGNKKADGQLADAFAPPFHVQDAVGSSAWSLCYTKMCSLSIRKFKNLSGGDPILVSQLSTQYKTADPTSYIIGAWQELDPVFIGRLAYLAKAKGIKVKLTEGYRSTARQTELYKQYLEYKRTGKGSIKLAAKPGSSWHEFRLAVDTSTQPIRGMNNAELHPYGLCKPITSEGWHIQPLETAGTSNRERWKPEEVEDVTEERIREIIQEELAGAGRPGSAWAKLFWSEMTKAGIIDGTNPQGVVTREQAATMLSKAMKSGEI